MNSPLPGNTSGTARLLLDAPSYVVGWQDLITVPSPAAGVSWTYPIDGRYYERLVAVNFTLTTGAAVANRFVTVVLLDTTGRIVTEVPGSGTVLASSVLNVNLHNNGPSYAAAASGSSFGFLPDVLVPPGWSWSASINGIQAADTVTAITILTHRLPNDTIAVPAGY